MNKPLGVGKIFNVKCEQSLIPAFPSLLFGTHSDTSYFDATSYLKQSEYNLSVDDFLKQFDYQIKKLILNYDIPTDETPLVIINTEGHQLINGALCYLFLSYVEPYFCGYSNDIINNVMTTGVAISDSCLVNFITQRFSPDTIKSIWDDKSDTKGKTSTGF